MNVRVLGAFAALLIVAILLFPPRFGGQLVRAEEKPFTPYSNGLYIRNAGTVYNVQGRSLLSAKEAKETMERVKKGIDDL